MVLTRRAYAIFTRKNSEFRPFFGKFALPKKKSLRIKQSAKLVHKIHPDKVLDPFDGFKPTRSCHFHARKLPILKMSNKKRQRCLHFDQSVELVP